MSSASNDNAALVFRFFTEIGILDQLANAELMRGLGPDMNPSEFRVLTHFVRRDHAVTPTHLARAFQMAKPSMTAILAKLERKGFVTIRPSAKDKRRKFVAPTPEGRAAHASALSRIAPLMAERLAGIDVSALSEILPVLSDLRAHLDAARNEADGLQAPRNSESADIKASKLS